MTWFYALEHFFAIHLSYNESHEPILLRVWVGNQPPLDHASSTSKTQHHSQKNMLKTPTKHKNKQNTPVHSKLNTPKPKRPTNPPRYFLFATTKTHFFFFSPQQNQKHIPQKNTLLPTYRHKILRSPVVSSRSGDGAADLPRELVHDDDGLAGVRFVVTGGNGGRWCFGGKEHIFFKKKSDSKA